MYTSPDEADAVGDVVTRILEAICTGDLATLRASLRVPGHHSLCSTKGKTLLHVAAECGHPEIVAYLLESGWPVNPKMKYGDTPLHCAARARIGPNQAEDVLGLPTPWVPREADRPAAIEPAVLQLLRSRGMATPESFKAIDDLPEEESAPLDRAVLELMRDRARLHHELTAAGIPFEQNDPAFRYVRQCYPDYLKVADLLIEHGAEVDAMDDGGRSPLFVAVESNSIQIIELLLDKKADPNLKQPARGILGYSAPSPMENALEWNNAAAADLLYRSGGQVNFAEWCPMHQAATNGRLEILLWLLAIGGDFNQQNSDGDTPLLCAAGGHEEVIAELCERKADCSVVNNQGQNLLHLSASCVPALKRFLKYGLDINARDQTGLAPLHYAARYTAEDSVPLLLDAGANVNAQDGDGNTPLHIIFFSQESRPDIEFPTFKALVDGGADNTIKNKEGKTPFALAQEYSYPAEYLELLATS